VYIPIVLVFAAAFLGIIGYFLHVAYGVSGSAIAPSMRLSAAATPSAATATLAPGEEEVPQSGGAASGNTSTAPLEGTGPPPAVREQIDAYRTRLAQNPRDLAALVGLASMESTAGMDDRAVPLYQRALALDPSNLDLRTDYAAALHGTHDDLGAFRELHLVLAHAPDLPAALYEEGVVAAAIGRRTQAAAAFRRFLRVAPHDVRSDEARTALASLESP
jgi:Flp pilus assembly protein TadD